jgi:DNA repair protein RecO (recombination protein O)
MQSLQTEAIILRRTNYGEADRILTILTPHHGKLSAIAKGVRKAKSKLAGSLELFATTELVIAQGRSAMGTVTAARLIHFYNDILKDYDRMSLAYELVKQINRVTEAVAEPEFYYLLRDSLMFLEQLAIDNRLVELWFRLRLAALLGRGLNVATDASGGPLHAGQSYNFDVSEMSFVASERGQFSSEHIKLLRLASVKSPTVISRVGGTTQLLDTCLWLARLIET